MHLMRRDDLVLLGGLAVACLLVFSDQISQALSVVREIEAAPGLQLLPALVLLTALLGLHCIWKGRKARLEAVAAAKVARQSDERAAGLVKLVAFTHALAESRDIEAIRLVAAAHLPLLVPDRPVWVMRRTRGRWESLLGSDRVAPEQWERCEGQLLCDAGADDGAGPGDECFPMVLGGAQVGVLGVSAGRELSQDEHSVLATAATLLAVSLKNAELFSEVRENSVRDSLTGCFTRAHALEALEVELRRTRRTQMPLSILVMTVDNVAAINQQHGHLCGDTVLATVGQRLKTALRGSDVKCRYGGVEFLVILTDTPIAGALRVSQTLRRVVAEDSVSWRDERVTVAASFGVATVRAGETDPTAALARAELALHRAKCDGADAVRESDCIAVPA